MQLDATTKAAYDAATTASARAQVVITALADPVTVTVYNASDEVVGTGTMATPWASQANGIITIGEVTAFEVTASGTPDADWYLRMESGAAYLEATFGLAGSGKEAVWSLASWTDGQLGTIGTGTVTCVGNYAPTFTVAPTTASLGSSGGTIQFTATDANNDTVVYSLPSKYLSSITINSSTGLVTVPSSAAGTSGNITVRASDGTLTTDATCAVTVSAASSVSLDYDVTFESSYSPFTLSAVSGAVVAVNATHAREGSKSLLTHCPNTSVWRAEVSLGYAGCVPMNQPSWYGWSVYADDNWVGDFGTWEAFGQWHTRDDSMSPPIAFETGYRSGYGTGNLLFRVSWASAAPPTSFSGNQIWNLGRMDDLKGQWLDFVMYVVPSSTSTGQLRLWMNGTEVATRLNAPNYVNDSIGPYWKMGIYNGWRYGDSTPGVTERKAWWDNYRQVTSSAATYGDVAPRGNRLAAP